MRPKKGLKTEAPFFGSFILRRSGIMHMSDALISAAVRGTMLAATAGVAVYSGKKLQAGLDEKKIPLMGVMGAFVFAAQMINFTIPATGSSGHIGGGMLLAMLLGPYAGFLTMASILLIQALFFGDGGLLAFGCNAFNMGFFTCFVAYPYIYKRITSKGINQKSIFLGALASVVVALQLGAFSVVLETLLSGKTELPFGTFVLLMQPIHLAIGIVEGILTAAVAAFVWNARPEILERAAAGNALGKLSLKRVLTVLTLAIIFVGGGLSWFASANPDGLEWSMEKTAGTAELKASSGIHHLLAEIQNKTAFLPDYGFKNAGEGAEEEAWPAVNAGTSLSGILGGVMTLALAAAAGLAVSLAKKRNRGA
jgi:cobalt/nickel transport system permease protein